jgi:small conductance mechanosensitive channel
MSVFSPIAGLEASGRKAVAVDAPMIARLTDMAGDFAVDLLAVVLIRKA